MTKQDFKTAILPVFFVISLIFCFAFYNGMKDVQSKYNKETNQIKEDLDNANRHNEDLIKKISELEIRLVDLKSK